MNAWMPKPTKKKKTIPKSGAKKKAWDAFSKYIRARDKKCVTCGAVTNLQAGHFIGGRHNSVLFDERNCHAQCYGCNVGKKGNMVQYYKFMFKRYGQNVIDELQELDTLIVQYKTTDYLELERFYKEKIENN